ENPVGYADSHSALNDDGVRVCDRCGHVDSRCEKRKSPANIVSARTGATEGAGRIARGTRAGAPLCGHPPRLPPRAASRYLRVENAATTCGPPSYTRAPGTVHD